MKHARHILLAALVLLAGATTALAQDGCYADYKAKRADTQTGKLELHYGVVRLAPPLCKDREAAAQDVSRRIAVDGWTLLRILSTFSGDDLKKKRDDAADYFLRY